MEYGCKETPLKNGKTALLRSPRPEDAAAMVELLHFVYSETPYLLRTPAEWTATAEQEEAYLRANLQSGTELMIVCELDGVLAGNCQIVRKNKVKNRHRAEVMISLRKDFWNLGIGTAMFREMIALAQGWGVMQLELEVIEGNHRAMALYEKMGFETVCAVPNAIRLENGTLLKEFRMIRPM